MPRQCSEKSKYHKNPEYICNPQSGRYVKRTGPTGQKLLGNNRVRRRSKKKDNINMHIYKNYVDHMEEYGYTVIPISWMTPNILKNIRIDMMNTIKKFPEYKPDTKMWVMGGFSAFCNPASFHNPFVRVMRMCAMKEMIPFFKEYINILPNPKQWKLEQIIDRLLYRPAGISATAESWHRDEASLAHDTDKILGGWWNFDDTSQYFSCVPGTHKGIRGHAGFAPIKDKKEKELYNKNKVKVEIPPGHIMIFYEHLVHEVLAKKVKHDMYRLFLGWRITKSIDSLYPLDTRFKDQSVMPLKSNQIPPMYAVLHWTNWRNKITKFSENFKDICIEAKRVKNGKDKGKTYDVVHRNMWSLKEYGFPLYPDYSKEEIAIYKPNRSWKLKCKDNYKTYKL